MSVLHAPRRPDVDRRLFWFPAIILPMFLLLFLRLWYLQVYKSQELIEKSESSRKLSIPKLAPRGAIYDRRGALVAGVQPQFVVTLKPAEAKKHPEVIARLSELLLMSIEEIEARIKEHAWRPQIPAPIKVGVDVSTATKIAEASDLPGVSIEEKPMRKYKDTKHFSHVLGYVWTPTGDDEKRLKEEEIEPAEYVGKQGVERAYERDLMGIEGHSMLEGRGKTKVESQEAAIPGKQLFLSLDASLQAYAQEIMNQRGFRGAVVAIEPKTGEILCMVSNPSFDSSIFEGGISVANFKLLQEDPGKPQLNRAISASYEPGSTMKIVTAIAAYRSGKLDRSTTVFCNGGYSMGRTKKLRCLGVHGGIGFIGAMSRSCNTFFCTIGVRAGTEEMLQTALDCGLGTRTGIELGGERKGNVPTKAWREDRSKPLPWYPGDLANMSVGQGYVNATPIQMANLAALVANNGTSYRPHLVRATKDVLTNETTYLKSEVLHQIKADDWFWDMLKDGLTGVIDNGTAGGARIQGLQWAGKTGSAEHGNKTQLTHSWFVGFAPRDNPKIAICVMAESAGHGGDKSAPIAKDVVVHYFNDSAKAAAKAASSSVAKR